MLLPSPIGLIHPTDQVFSHLHEMLINSCWLSLTTCDSSLSGTWTFSVSHPGLVVLECTDLSTITLASKLYTKTQSATVKLDIFPIISTLICEVQSCTNPVVGFLTHKSLENLITHRLFLNPVTEMLYLAHHHLLDVAQRRFTCISSTLTY